MTCVRSSKLMKATSVFLIVAVVLPLTPVGTVVAGAQTDEVQQVMIFPVVDATGAGITNLSRLATNKLQAALNELPDAVCTEFGPTSPLVRRAVSEGLLLPVYVEADPRDPVMAIGIAHILGMDAVVLASLEALNIREEPRQAEVTLLGRYFLVEPNYDRATEQPVAVPQARHTVTLTGVSRALAGYRGSNRPLMREALDDAAYKFKEIVAGRSPAEIAAGREPAKKNKWKWLGPAVAVVLMAWLLGNKGNEAGYTSAAGATAPTPTTLTVASYAIQLYWNPPPATQLTLLRYQIQRSVNNSAWQYIDAGNADASRTSWPDSDVIAGKRYRYRMRAVYTNQAISGWMLFDQVTFTQ